MDAARIRPPRWLLTLVAAVAAAVLAGGTAAAGGWAVTTLDEVPEAGAGEVVAVGFTIRQHGQTPVNLDEGVAIELTDADGTVLRFPAVQDGPTGHYLASVTMPTAAGSYRWAVQQGWFGPQELGRLAVGGPAAPSAPSGGTDDPYPAVLRYGLPVLAVALAGMAVVDVAGRRRRLTGG